MADIDQKLSRIERLHQGTLRLLSIAAEMRDDFLQYLYKIALQDLEEKSGAINKIYNGDSAPSSNGDPPPPSQDPAIRELAAKVRDLARKS